MLKKSPCVNCPKKGCGVYHAECKDYLEYSNYNRELREKIRKDRELYAYKQQGNMKMLSRECKKPKGFRSGSFR